MIRRSRVFQPLSQARLHAMHSLHHKELQRQLSSANASAISDPPKLVILSWARHHQCAVRRLSTFIAVLNNMAAPSVEPLQAWISDHSHQLPNLQSQRTQKTHGGKNPRKYEELCTVTERAQIRWLTCSSRRGKHKDTLRLKPSCQTPQGFGKPSSAWHAQLFHPSQLFARSMMFPQTLTITCCASVDNFLWSMFGILPTSRIPPCRVLVHPRAHRGFGLMCWKAGPSSSSAN